jgi:hypothetical protein
MGLYGIEVSEEWIIWLVNRDGKPFMMAAFIIFLAL